MKRPLLTFSCWAIGLWTFPVIIQAGDLNKKYFGATKAGAWSEYSLTSPDGTTADYSYQRNADSEGHPAIELIVKVTAGPGKDTKSKTGYILPHDFSFEREGLNYGRFAETMTMDYNGATMTVDPQTLKAIREQTKNFAGALKFKGTEKIGA